ncbi:MULTISPECIES: esterase/lipase family protein [Micromonospora]|uniref:esterase/lipase family protein n=1 Tax=Micromonospora TaxID=1873 RepID=UPI00189012D3|nr:alpha/beta fold hydrolase [Micromonospora sp. ANENR4]MBF5032999.1 alpha/beta fold hydrolase [Micromonospora sp. ANENR4]
MREAAVVFVHGFWSSPATWDRIIEKLEDDPVLTSLRFDRFGYRSPKLWLPLLPSRIPDLNDVAQDLANYIEHQHPNGPLALVTHSQGGLVVQRCLAWMLRERRKSDVARIELVVMLACPNGGSEYLGSLRVAMGFGRRPQARDLQPHNTDVADALRTVMHSTRIPLYAYSGSSDNVVRRASGQGPFRHVGSLPGDHFSILDPDLPGSLTVRALRNRLVETFTARPPGPEPTLRPGPPSVDHEVADLDADVLALQEVDREPAGHKYNITFYGPSYGTSIGDRDPNSAPTSDPDDGLAGQGRPGL